MNVRSSDGTTIAYERSGSGPALILVDGALCSRRFRHTQREADCPGTSGGEFFTGSTGGAPRRA